MKRILFITALPALLALLSLEADAQPRKIKGSKAIRTETREIGTYCGLNVSRGIKATLTDDAPGRLVVEANENILPYLDIAVDTKGILHLDIDRKIASISNLTISIRVPHPETLQSVTASSGAEVTSRTISVSPLLDIRASSGAEIEIACQSDGCTLSASSGAEIKANVSARRCAVKANSGAEISIKGSADECRITTSSGAECRARNLITRNTEANASSGSEIRITCTETIEATASSGGGIDYWGDCRRINETKSITGNISHKFKL